ncbi:MAG: HK97 gp10 family phage protein [Thiopseudomonas sp.]|nr:HK97 gp10 family phage protein [Thiopseudomonas sp.]
MATRRRSSIKGDFKLRGVLRRIGNQMDSDVRPAMQKAADLVLQTQKSLIPVDTGAGRDALTAFVSKAGLDAQIGMRGKKNNKKFFYLRFIEYGTKGSKDSARGPVKNKSDGQDFFGYSPDVPARPAHPFIRPSYDTNKDAIRELIKEAIDSTLAKAAGSASDSTS